MYELSIKGDIAAAGNVLWQTIKLQWTKGVAFISKLWNKFKTFFLNIKRDIFYGLAYAAAKTWELFDATMIRSVNFLKKTWNGVSTFFTKLWAGIIGKAKTFWTWMKIYANPFSDLSKEDKDKQYEQQVAKIKAETTAKIDGIKDKSDKKATEREADAERKLAAKKAFHQGLLSELAGDYVDDSKDIDDAYAKSISEGEKKLAEAKAAYDKAIEDAKAPPEKKTDDGSSGQSENDKTAQSIAEAAKSTPDLGLAQSAIGTFIGERLGGLGSGGVAERTAKASEKTAKNTEEIADKISDGNGSVFT